MAADTYPIVQGSSQSAPTLTGISPGAGTIAGGTSVTLTGTLFLSAPKVLFGTMYATNVVQVSATQITCTSPPVSGAGAVAVQVLNRDGQASNVLAGAFTYS